MDLTGKQFGRLVVVERVSNDKHGNLYWLCRCSCGNENGIVVRGSSLKISHTNSCGCLKIEKATKHSHSQKNKTYKTWQGMIQRCTNPNNDGYKGYGGRGIAVCDRWINSFSNFLEDMGERPSEHTIERRDNQAGYCSKNCYWATLSQQQRNTRRNHLITFNKETHCIAVWSEKTEIFEHVIH